jgi:histone H3
MSVIKKSTTQSVRHTKVMRDSIQGITKPSIQRLFQTAGNKRRSGLVYEEVRGILKVKIEDIMRNAVAAMEHDRRKTLQVSDLAIAISILDSQYLGAGLNENTVKTFSTRRSRQRGKKEPSTSDGDSTKKPHRFKPGTVALREIRYQQKNSDSFAIPKRNFSRLVREVGQDYKEDVRYSSAFMELFQLVIESYLIDLLHSANLSAINCGRQTVTPSDLRLVRVIRGEI